MKCAGRAAIRSTQRRGDIGDPNDWYHDLFAFTQLVRERHPGAKVVWFGESMGALIAVHAMHEAPPVRRPAMGWCFPRRSCVSAMTFPRGRPALVQVAATTLPLARVSLDALTGGQDVQMTQKSHHGDQAKKNPYHIEQHTLRLIGTLGRPDRWHE